MGEVCMGIITLTDAVAAKLHMLHPHNFFFKFDSLSMTGRYTLLHWFVHNAFAMRVAKGVNSNSQVE